MGAKLVSIATVAACLLACAPEGPTAIIVGSLIPDEDCIVAPESAFLLKGRYDVSVGVTGQCNASYNMAMLINSYLIKRGSPAGNPSPARAEPNVLQITRAEVSLLRVDDSLVPFPGLPNPFSVTTYATVPPAEFEDPGSGVALVEVIPSFYKTQLRTLGLGRNLDTVVAAVKLFGETTGGVQVELAEYRFPIQLCEGCYTVCGDTLEPEDLDKLTDGVCADNAAADGRACIQNCGAP